MNTRTEVRLPRLAHAKGEDGWMMEFLEDRDLLNSLFAEFGSPLHLVNVDPFLNNFKAYAEVLKQHNLAHMVCFARKANKCMAFVYAARDAGFGVDTASYRELKDCLDAGCDTSKLVCTAAVKSEELMRLAIVHGVLVVLDNADEVALAQILAAKLNKRLRVGVRVSGFCFNGQKTYSRFGFDIEEVEELFKGPLNKSMLDFEGFHFHLNGYSVGERAEAIVALVQVADRLKARGIVTRFIDAGGGLLMNYLADVKQWEAFKEQLAAAQRGERDPLTFDNDGLGLRWEDGKMRGKLNTYPYFNTLSRGVFLEEVLSYATPPGSPGALLRERGIEFRIEPGRSLLDQSGMTVARVAFRKRDSRGELLIGLEMNGSQCRSASADFLVDPILLSGDGGSRMEEQVEAYLVGAYCLEQDFILKRKLVLDFMPRVGDVFCFVNTAGYLMHFYERDAHLLGFAKNLVVKSTEGGFEVEVDG